MFLLDSLLIGGIRFVLDKVAAAAEQELDNDEALRQQLLDAQLRVELGEMSEVEFATLESDILARLRDLRARREEIVSESAEYRITGVEIEEGS